MKPSEMSKIFSAMMLAWPNAEVFKGDRRKLKPTIELWTTCLADIDFWTGQQAILRLMRTCKFPPTIAEMRSAAENVSYDMRLEVRDAFLLARNEIYNCKGDLPKAYSRLPATIQAVINSMGGMGTFLPKDGDAFNFPGFETAYKNVARNTAMSLPSEIEKQ